MIIDENKFIKSVNEWAARFKFLSADKVVELLKEANAEYEQTVCPRCHGVFLARVKRCPLCGYESEAKK